jgi:hypothetical protein
MLHAHPLLCHPTPSFTSPHRRYIVPIAAVNALLVILLLYLYAHAKQQHGK